MDEVQADVEKPDANPTKSGFSRGSGQARFCRKTPKDLLEIIRAHNGHFGPANNTGRVCRSLGPRLANTRQRQVRPCFREYKGAGGEIKVEWRERRGFDFAGCVFDWPPEGTMTRVEPPYDSDYNCVCCNT